MHGLASSSFPISFRRICDQGRVSQYRTDDPVDCFLIVHVLLKFCVTTSLVPVCQAICDSGSETATNILKLLDFSDILPMAKLVYEDRMRMVAGKETKNQLGLLIYNMDQLREREERNIYIQ